MSDLEKRSLFRPEEGHGDEGIDLGDHEGDLKGIEILDKQEGDKQAPDNGPDGFEDIDLSDGGGAIPFVSGIEFTAKGEEGAVGDGDRKQDEEG